jgi:hypothetical protein
VTTKDEKLIMNEAKIIYSECSTWLQITSAKIIIKEAKRLSEDPNL